MSRIEINQEKILEDYNKGKSLQNIADAYGLSRYMVTKILKENKVKIGSKSKKIPQKVIDEIVYNYTILNQGLIATGKKFNLSQKVVSSILKNQGVKLRTYAEAKDLTRKYNLDDDFFKKQNHNMAYMLGFIAANGNVAKKENGIFIEVHQRDEAILQFFNKITSNTRPLKYYIHSSSETPVAKFRAWSSTWKRDLAVYNIVPNKTLVLKPPYFLEKQYIPTFIKGYFDGDGSIYYNSSKQQYFCDITGASKEMIEWIRSFLATEYGIIGTYSKTPTKNNVIIYKITYNKDNLLKLRKIWYELETSNCCLERKKEKFYLI